MVEKIHKSHERELFTVIYNLLRRGTAHMEVISITWYFRQKLVTLELTAKATGGSYEIVAVQYIL